MRVFADSVYLEYMCSKCKRINRKMEAAECIYKRYAPLFFMESEETT